MPDENDNDIGLEALAGKSLEELLNPISDDELDTASTNEKKSDEPVAPVSSTAISQESIDASIRKMTDALEDRVAELTQKLEYTRGELAESKRSGEAGDVSGKEQTPTEFTYDETALAAEMAEDAPKAMIKFAKAYMAHELNKVKGDVTKDVDTRLANSKQQQEAVRAYEEDRNATATAFAEQLNDADFQKEANAEMANIIRKRGGTTWGDYKTGDLENAATRVALRWTRTGRMGTSNANGNGKKGDSLSLKEVVRRAPNDSLGNPNGRKPTGTPKTIDELYPDSPRDRVIAKKMMSEYGVPEDRYVARLLKSRKEDGDFVG